MKIYKEQRIKPLTTFDIGGPAAYYCRVSTREDLYQALDFAAEHHLDYYVLAGGSNTLFTDHLYRGMVIHLIMDHIHIHGQEITIDAGASLMDLLTNATHKGLCGAEELAGIPGSVGGAVRGNAGAFGREIADVISHVEVLDVAQRTIKTMSKSDCAFGYRTSFFKTHPEEIILSVTVRLADGVRDDSEKLMQDIIARRNKKHVQNIKSAGSFFVNPKVSSEIQEQFFHEKGVRSHGGRVPAGWLLESVGLAHKRIGDIQAGDMHANYFINVGKGTAEEVLQLASLAKTRVRDTFGVQLKEEVQLVGL